MKREKRNEVAAVGEMNRERFYMEEIIFIHWWVKLIERKNNNPVKRRKNCCSSMNLG